MHILVIIKYYLNIGDTVRFVITEFDYIRQCVRVFAKQKQLRRNKRALVSNLEFTFWSNFEMLKVEMEVLSKFEISPTTL